jgi:hypothetical protein
LVFFADMVVDGALAPKSDLISTPTPMDLAKGPFRWWVSIIMILSFCAHAILFAARGDINRPRAEVAPKGEFLLLHLVSFLIIGGTHISIFFTGKEDSPRVLAGIAVLLNSAMTGWMYWKVLPFVIQASTWTGDLWYPVFYAIMLVESACFTSMVWWFAVWVFSSICSCSKPSGSNNVNSLEEHLVEHEMV